MSDEVKALFAAARNGEMTPRDFHQALSKLGVGGALSMLYVRDAFEIPLDQAKALVLEAEPESENLAKELEKAVDYLEAEKSDPLEKSEGSDDNERL